MTLVSLFLLAGLQAVPQDGAAPRPEPLAQATRTTDAAANPTSAAQDLDEQRRRWAATEERLRARIAELEREIARLQAERIEREREWLGYTRAIGDLAPAGATLPSFEAVRETPVPGAAARATTTTPTAADAARDEEAAARDAESRSRRAFVSLRALFIAEEIRGLDLLEIGTVEDGWTGPVVLRVLDEVGRPMGSITAARLRLEGSRAARTLTLVLEDGYERRAGEHIAFPVGPGSSGSLGGAGGVGVRRIALPYVDPSPWLEAVPELFQPNALPRVVDDGRWDRVRVRITLNELLARNAAGGWYRLRSIGGVQGGVLREVHLEHVDRDGRLDRRLFADRLTVLERESGLLVQLEDGAQVRGGEKTAFLDGRFRIYLPRARADHWRAAGVPGLSDPPEVER